MDSVSVFFYQFVKPYPVFVACLHDKGDIGQRF